jgi:small-conductance mechanosensitive channel
MWQNILQSFQQELHKLSNTLPFAPAWVIWAALLIGAFVVACLLHAGALALLDRMLRRRRPYLNRILTATKNPARAGLLLIALAIALPTVPLGAESKLVFVRCLVLATICLIGWTALKLLQIGANLYLRNFRLDVPDNLLARKHVTQVRVLVRVLDTVIVLLTVGSILMTFDTVRQYGISVFASAGVAGVIFGLAAQPVLSNLIAGIQLALTQPIRLEDAVTVQNEYGCIEEINATYVVIRLWDLRRLIVPLNYFIQQPFYNWTRQAGANIGSVLLYLDYSAPIERIRAKAVELAAKTTQPGGKLVNLQVTNTSAEAIELRVLVTAASVGDTSNFCAELREQLIGFLQSECPQALPRRRHEITEVPLHQGGKGANPANPERP